MAGISKNPTDATIDILMQEYLRLCTGIVAIENANEKLLGFGFTLISLSAVAGLFQKVMEIFFVLPIAVIGILAYSSVSYACIYSMAAYKKHIEDVINETMGRRLLIWEELVSERERASVNSRLLLVIYFIVSASISMLSVYQVVSHYGPKIGIGLTSLLLVLFIAFLFGVGQMHHTFRRTYGRAKELHRDGRSA